METGARGRGGGSEGGGGRRAAARDRAQGARVRAARSVRYSQLLRDDIRTARWHGAADPQVRKGLVHKRVGACLLAALRSPFVARSPRTATCSL